MVLRVPNTTVCHELRYMFNCLHLELKKEKEKEKLCARIFSASFLYVHISL